MDQLLRTARELEGNTRTPVQHNGTSFQQNICDIWASIMDDNVFSIGVYGIEGVGKTTIVKAVHDKLLNDSQYFPRVYWVNFSQEFSIHKMQNNIARALGVGISHECDENKRADELFQLLKNMRRFVLVLDNVGKQIEPEKIGIPVCIDGCKLLITSRSLEVCQNMGCDKVIKVNTLSENEAWDLFLMKLGHADLSQEEEEICKKMMEVCNGLPLALVTVAGSMSGVTDIHEWRDALEELKGSCMGNADVENEFLPVLMFSFNRLKDPKLKDCFLYCSLYPGDYDILRDQLIANFISEELMDRRSIRRAELDEGHAILTKLEKACLLEIRTHTDTVKMHDSIRDMALKITKHKPRYMVVSGRELTEIPCIESWTQDLDKVCLMDNDIHEISPGMSPNCPRLSSLILSKNQPLKFIPDCFFERMLGLCVLNLSGTSIERLPNSVSHLEKLKALLLGGCENLVYVPPLEKLRLLRELDLTFTSIEELPQGIESLTNLELLYLYCFTLKDMPPGILSSLSHLRELILPCHAVPTTDVEGLKQLELFDGGFDNVSDLNLLIESQQNEGRLMSSYHIIVKNPGDAFGYDEYCPPCKVIHFGIDSLEESSVGIDEYLLPLDIEELLFERSGLNGCLLDYFPILNNARHLKKCDMSADDIECMMRLSHSEEEEEEEEEEQCRGVPFQSLTDLSLYCLPNFIGLVKWEVGAAIGTLPPGTFSLLKVLRIYDCGSIKKLLPWSLAENLENLDVSSCDELEEIIGDDGEDDGKGCSANSSTIITLPKLKDLSLYNLPKLKSICKGTIRCDSIESISIMSCTELKNVPLLLPLLPGGQPSPPTCLKDIKIGREENVWWESLQWDHPNTPTVLQPFVREN